MCGRWRTPHETIQTVWRTRIKLGGAMPSRAIRPPDAASTPAAPASRATSAATRRRRGGATSRAPSTAVTSRPRSCGGSDLELLEKVRSDSELDQKRKIRNGGDRAAP